MHTGNSLLPAYCFDVLESSLKGKPSPSTAALPDESFPLFVTWHIHAEDDDSSEEKVSGNML
ncbi:hypothetical protein BJ684DRAFT_21776 [Piptocephalis cylindrospora]|uniref:Uncharacterized protein n=1 Tax=Piptocephalis cylindrospora TaxID=1907219 RepID=A0A4P9XZ06_9FUNG|nr:hypothetical protein BJ684DRAFT_21776 [Piptocephalis cylindrospora]|eukprot:RKP11647.1 hypothetical protein BJ684DRAFT_21776 [Piptocephalis cylindrospora]